MSAAGDTWLVLAHSFNMDGRASSQMITDKIPHLLARGIRPVVVSAVTGRRDSVIEHHQVWSWFPSALRFDLRHVLDMKVGSPTLRRALKSVLQVALLPFYLLEKLFVPLDSQWSWFMPACLRGARLVRQQRPAVVYSGGGAHGAHIAARRLSLRYGIPWIAEIFDPLVIAGDPVSWPKRRWKAWVETIICRDADIAIWYTDNALARARARHPELGERGRVMYPGVNPPERGKVPWKKGESFVLAHFGSLAPTRSLAVTLEALSRLLNRHPNLESVVRLRTYGGEWDPVSETAFDRFGFKDVVERIGRLEFDPLTGKSGRERVREAMETADCLLLLHGEDASADEYIPSKTYEYLFTQRPILALVTRGPDFEKLLKQEGHTLVRGDDPDAVAEAIRVLVERWSQQGLPDSGRVSPYSTEAAVGQMVEWMHLIPSPSRGEG